MTNDRATPRVSTIGYVVKAFPQLSESFVENEIRAVVAAGRRVEVGSLLPASTGVEGPTEVPVERRHLVPTGVTRYRALGPWLRRRPRVLVRNLRRAVAARSQTMARGIVEGAWLATTFERLGVEHLHAHFATDAASAAMVAAELLDVPWTFTIHARELYLRTAGLGTKCEAADAVITVCEYNVGELERVIGRRPDRLHIVRCGVDLDRFPPRPDAPDRPGLHLVAVGRLVSKKGFEHLIDAVAIASGRGIDVTAEIIGTGELAGSLRDAAAAAGVADRVRFAGARTPDEVAVAVRDADAFVLPNVIADDGDRDSMPVVTKEAMASAVPVITTDCVANPEMVDETVGWLVPPADADALADAIEAVHALSPSERHALGCAGRARVETDFAIETETARLLAVIDDLAR